MVLTLVAPGIPVIGWTLLPNICCVTEIPRKIVLVVSSHFNLLNPQFVDFQICQFTLSKWEAEEMAELVGF